MKRILLAGFKHETNTFSQLPTTLESYRARSLTYGADIPTRFRNTKSEIAAFLDACKQNDWQAVHPVIADATPSGKVTQETFENISGLILNSIVDDGPIHGVLLSLHGAMVCTHVEDGEGELLRLVRDKVGPDVPIGVTLDLHANVTDKMAKLADIIVSYRTYPHIDQYEVATEVADMLRATLAGEIRPACTVARGQMLDGADHGRTTAPGPMTEVQESAAKLKQANDSILSVSISAGFPWADIQDTGPSALIISNGEGAEFKDMADGLVKQIWESRHRSTVISYSVDDAIGMIKSSAPSDKAIVLADFADNPGGGAYGDSTRLLRAMIDANIYDATYGMIYDPVAVRTCTEQGLGAHVVVAIGGKIDPRFGEPIPVTGRVIAVTDGTLRLQGPMMAGTPVDMGPTVVLQVGGIDIILTSGRFQTYDRMYFEHARIDLSQKAVIAVKSAHHFRAAFGPLASEIIVVDSGGGLTSRNFKELPYKNVRRPVYPLDVD